MQLVLFLKWCLKDIAGYLFLTGRTGLRKNMCCFSAPSAVSSHSCNEVEVLNLKRKAAYCACQKKGAFKSVFYWEIFVVVRSAGEMLPVLGTSFCLPCILELPSPKQALKWWWYQDTVTTTFTSTLCKPCAALAGFLLGWNTTKWAFLLGVVCFLFV